MGSLLVVTPKTRRFFSHTLRTKLQRLAVWLAAWIDAGPMRAFLLLTIFYVVVVFGLSSLKLLWLDELITLHIARLGSVSAIWQALGRGADPNPPLTHLLVHLCLASSVSASLRSGCLRWRVTASECFRSSFFFAGGSRRRGPLAGLFCR